MIPSILRRAARCHPGLLTAKHLVVMSSVKDRSGPADERSVSLHAFVDESRRNDTYLLAAAVVSPGQLTKLRKLLTGLRMPNQRGLHFKKETPARRRQILSTLLQAVVHVDVYLACCRTGEERARRTCVARLTSDMVKLGVTRLVFDSREVRDDHDLLTIRTALGPLAWERGCSTSTCPARTIRCCGSLMSWPGATARVVTGGAGSSRWWARSSTRESPR
ncbi:hypothetical protein [Lentzea fradiae]|uniref:hypothetical protein n=1 Tax=Lentzea fradiae TaxID=200378 RepID=UPI001FE1A74E|nr:hypothetical protein [Lentzea fradiae]